MPIEYTIIISVISVICTVIGVSIGMSNLRRNSKLDDKQESSQITRITVQLEHIDAGVNSVKHDMTEIKDDIKEQRERMVRVEESAKQAHKRLDELAGRRTG